MNRTTRSTILKVTLTVVILAVAWSLRAAGSENETPGQAIKRLSDDNAMLRMNLTQARGALSKANGEANLAVTKMNANIEARAAMNKTLQAANARIDGMAKENARLAGLIKTLGEKEQDAKLKEVLLQLTDALGSVKTLQTENTLLAQQLEKKGSLHQEATAAVEKLTRAVKDRDTKLSNLRQDLAIVRGQQIAPIKPAVVVEAKKPLKPRLTLSGVKILAVRENLASINAGTERGIKAGTKLLILRENKLVGILDIVEVASGTSAGVVSNSKNGVRTGDDVQAAP